MELLQIAMWVSLGLIFGVAIVLILCLALVKYGAKLLSEMTEEATETFNKDQQDESND